MLIRTVIAVVIFVGVVVVLNVIPHRDKSTSPARDHARPAATSSVWKQGDAWRVSVVQDTGAVTPDGTGSASRLVYEFAVTRAPSTATDGLWQVTVHQRGAEGPFAQGWRLLYAAVGHDKMQLKMVAQGDQKAVEAELSSIVLGLNFPLTTTYTAPPPKSSSLTSAQIAKMNAAPRAPTSAPPVRDSETGGTGPAPDGALPKEGDPNVIPAPGTGAPMPNS